jgi:glycosyltransferase involved in cell wall biosynthesis
MLSQENISVSIVVPCRNEIRHIEAFLNSVMQQDFTGMTVEILIADGMSDDGTRQVLDEYRRKCPALRVVDNPEQIVSTALNRAIREVHGEIVIRMDAHTIYAPDYVRSCVGALIETNADNVGGPALTRADGYTAKAIAHAFHTPFACGGGKYHDPQYEGSVDTVPYGCWRKSTLERLGPFDEELVRAEDYEFNVRIVSSGGKVWQSPKITSWYSPRANLWGLFRQYFQYGFWKVAVARKHRRIAFRRSLGPGTCLLVGIILPLCIAVAGLCGSVRWQNTLLALWLALMGVYFTASLTSACWVARRKGWSFLPFLPIVFATYQFSFALGSLLGVACQRATWSQSPHLRYVLTSITR